MSIFASNQKKPRYLYDQILADLSRKMVFLGGPRQVGKTTLARAILEKTGGTYLNYDIPVDRDRILRYELPESTLTVFDELHKYRRWRGFLKGLFDEYHPQRRFLVTGSARLDLYRFGGDSLQGRYHYLRLMPLSVAELKLTSQIDLEQLNLLGGFPEPFFGKSETQAKRWAIEYRSRLLQEDVEKLEHVTDLSLLELLMIRLPELVGSPLSLNALREDLEVSNRSIARWVTILEHLYAIVRLPPFGSPKIRAVKKEQKHYHLNWALVPNAGSRFENLIAIHLLKWVYYQVDCLGEEYELRYFRDTDGREVDFIITKERVPLVAIEVKLSDDAIAPSLKYFKVKFPDVRAYQLSLHGQKDYVSKEGIRVCPALGYLQGLI